MQILAHTKQIKRQMWNGNEVDAFKYVDAHFYKMAHKTQHWQHDDNDENHDEMLLFLN